MTTVKDLIKHLSDCYAPDDVIAAAIWQVEDVIDRAEEIGRSLTHAEAVAIVHKLDKYHDANVGISWEVIDAYL